jgi:hypothetical protein
MGFDLLYRPNEPYNIYRTFFSNTHGKLSRIGHMLGHKTNLSKIRRIKIISSNFWDQKDMKIKITNSKTLGKYAAIWKLSNVLPNNQWITEENQRGN